MINEEDIKKFFEEIGLVKGIENIKKFKEQILDKYYIEKEKLIKDRFFKVGDITYVLDEHEYPHDERCEGTMCWCASRAKRENLKKWKKYFKKNEIHKNN